MKPDPGTLAVTNTGAAATTSMSLSASGIIAMNINASLGTSAVSSPAIAAAASLSAPAGKQRIPPSRSSRHAQVPVKSQAPISGTSIAQAATSETGVLPEPAPSIGTAASACIDTDTASAMTGLSRSTPAVIGGHAHHDDGETASVLDAILPARDAVLSAASTVITAGAATGAPALLKGQFQPSTSIPVTSGGQALLGPHRDGRPTLATGKFLKRIMFNSWRAADRVLYNYGG